MSTIKSSNEHLTLNADGSSKDIKFQANGVEKASISSAGAFTSTTIDATKLTGNLPAISGASLTSLPADATKLPLAGGTMTGQLTVSMGSGAIVKVNEGGGSYLFMEAGGSDGYLKVKGGDDLILCQDNTQIWKIEGSNKHVTHSNTGSIPTNEGVHHIVNNNNSRTLMVDSTKTSGVDQDTMRLQNSQDSSNGSYDLLTGRNGGGQVFKVQDSGKAYNSTNTWGSLSDQRVKQDITDASSQWDDIKAVKVRKYKLKKLVNRDGADNTPYHIGVVAQELESAGISNLVDESKPEKEDVALHADFGTIDSEGVFTAGENKKEVKYSILYMKSIKALQEAMDRIETLEAKVKALEEA